MAYILDEKTRRELKPILAQLVKPVKLIYFTQEHACGTCREQQKLLEEFAELSDKLQVEIYELVLNGDMAMKYEVNMIPCTAVVGEKDYGIRFYGLTAGYEFSSFLQTILMVSTSRSGLSPQLEQLVRLISEPIRMLVFVTLTCPYCFQMVHTAHQFAFVNDKIKSDMIDSGEFPILAQQYDVSGVPRTVVNETHSFLGALPPEAVYMELLKAVMPSEYRRIEEAMLESQLPPHIKKGDERHTYEVIIVGGGPAAMSAAIYASRKDLDILIIAKEIGGQVNFTAGVENFLGLPGIEGHEMALAFRQHMEQFPMSESLGFIVSSVIKENNHFIVTTEDGKHFRGSSVIFATGKEYKKLGIPGEERFIGKGIAFCATCDAPLYRNKRVAVIGGGNSAFTAVRDLMSFASEVNLIHRRDSFSADKVLMNDALHHPKVKVHQNTVVREVLGKEKLEGLRLISADGKTLRDMPVDGVFLEIGLTPNSIPLKNLDILTEKHEVPVDCRAATPIEGLFAAGDVTDVPEKQISIAVGDGAKAALSAHKYLLANKMTRSRVRIGESWQ